MLCPKTMPRLGPGSIAGFHHAIRRIWLSEFWPRAAGRRRPQRTDRAPARAVRDRRLSRCRHHHRPVWACGVWHAREHHSGFRAGRRDVAIPDRARTRTRPALGHAARHIRPRCRPIGAHRARHRRARLWGRASRLAWRRNRRTRVGDVGDRHRTANPGRTRPTPARVRPARLCYSIVPGHGGRAPAGGPAVARAWRRQRPYRPGGWGAGRYLLNPFFRLLAQTGSREVMTAAALLVVLGAALTMQKAGMSMALGAFLAGVLLAESNYRHELAADIEPFRGLLLALFFMGIGMSIDMTIVRANLWLIFLAAITITLLKAAIVWLLFRATCVHRGDALRAGSVLTGAGEFAFVLIPLGSTLGVLDARQASILTAIAAITMLLGPLVATLTDRLLRRLAEAELREPEDFSDASGSVLVIGFGRFGQIVSQCLLAEGIDVTTIDNDPEMMESAAGFGFKVYYGDGTRLDVLRAAGAREARVIAVCIDDREAASRIVDLV